MVEAGHEQPASQDFRAAVSDLVESARNEAGNAEALAARLQSLGIVRDKGNRYSVSAISNWVQGRTMPPGDVLLAVAYVGGQSLDERMHPSKPVEPGDGSTANQELKAEVARLQAEVMHLYSRMGEPYERGAGVADQADDSQRTGTTDR